MDMGILRTHIKLIKSDNIIPPKAIYNYKVKINKEKK